MAELNILRSLIAAASGSGSEVTEVLSMTSGTSSTGIIESGKIYYIYFRGTVANFGTSKYIGGTYILNTNEVSSGSYNIYHATNYNGVNWSFINFDHSATGAVTITSGNVSVSVLKIYELVGWEVV